jgi:hypothetical protein
MKTLRRLSPFAGLAYVGYVAVPGAPTWQQVLVIALLVRAAYLLLIAWLLLFGLAVTLKNDPTSRDALVAAAKNYRYTPKRRVRF